MATDSQGYPKNTIWEPVRNTDGTIRWPVRYYHRPVTKEDKERRALGIVPPWRGEVHRLRLLHTAPEPTNHEDREYVRFRLYIFKDIRQMILRAFLVT